MSTVVSRLVVTRFGLMSKLTAINTRQVVKPVQLCSNNFSTSRILREESQKEEKDWMANFSADPKDRTREIPLETSMAYLESEAYRKTYGDQKVWEPYRRNFTKARINADTRKTCIRKDKISTGNPCPICRDEYLVVDYRNLKLINQFVNEYSGAIYSSKKTGVCQRQYTKIVVAIQKARELGILTIDQPFIQYDYSKYQ